MTETELREKDRTVISCISDGHADVQQITAETTLSNREVNYCFRKLEEAGLIDVEKPDGMVEREIDGQTRVFEAPKHATLTADGEDAVERITDDRLDQYRDLSYEELVERVAELERRVEAVESALKNFRKQVLSKLK